MAEPIETSVDERRGPRLWHVVACTLAVLLVAEGAVRAASTDLQRPRQWHNWETENKVKRIDELGERGGASVVFIGSSQMNAQLDPVPFQQARSDPRPPFNAAINGSDPRMQELWIRHVVVPRLKPSVVVLGLTSRDLNDAVRPVQFNLFRESEATRALTGRLSILERIERRAERYSYVLRYRDSLRRPYDTAEGGDEREDQLEISPLGVLRAIIIFSTPKYVFTEEFKKRMRRDSGKRFRMGGAQLASLERTLTFLHDEGITAVVLNNSLTPDAFTILPGGRASHARYRTLLAELAPKHDATLLDAEPLFTSSVGFADPYHVNFEGRAKVTAWLAERVPAARR